MEDEAGPSRRKSKGRTSRTSNQGTKVCCLPEDYEEDGSGKDDAYVPADAESEEEDAWDPKCASALPSRLGPSYWAHREFTHSSAAVPHAAMGAPDELQSLLHSGRCTHHSCG